MPYPLKRKFPETIIQTVESVQQRPHKKLRLTARKHASTAGPSFQTLSKLVGKAATSNETLKLLTQISDILNTSTSEEVQDFIRKICDQYKREQESAVRVKILSLFAEFANDAANEGTALVDEITLLLKNEKSPKVISQGLNSMNKIGQSQQLPLATIIRVVLFAKTQLTNVSHNVQRHALKLLGDQLPLREAEKEKESLELISQYTDSQDSRVRAQAFRSILTLAKRGADLPSRLYYRAIESIKDDYELVRKESIELVAEIGVKHPEEMIEVTESTSKMRMIDAAFGHICSALCDLSMQVRTHAANILGRLTEVSSEFLNQTLDKKLMSNLRRKKSSHERYAELYQSGEWSSGKKWADDAPKEHVNASTVSLMASGACGALVHGLEDEFLEVRTAAVDSMCRLAISNPRFAVLSLDFLVDMFNDEIEGVRLQAIASLTAISQHITLREDQLETMLSSLEDYSVEVREELHVMLGACHVSTQSCLLMVVQKVLDVLSKYPQDKYSAFGCMQKIGAKHQDICMALVAQLLQDHPFFDNTEKDVEDPAYVCILIMIFNAAQNSPPTLGLLPEITMKHYSYLRDTMPNLVPPLPNANTNELKPSGDPNGSRQLLETILENIRQPWTASKAQQDLLKATQDNLHRLALIDPELTGTADYTATYLGAKLLIEQLQATLTVSNNRTPSKECLNQLMKKCLKLQNSYSALTLSDLLMVKQISLRASALHLVLIVKDRSQSALAPCQLLMSIATETNTFLNENPTMKADTFTSLILAQLATVNDPKPGRVFREILPIVQTAPTVPAPDANFDIKICTARILDPTTSTLGDNVVKVTAGLIAAVPFFAEIDHLRESQRQDLRMRIKYPDQVVHLVVPRLRDLKRIVSTDDVKATGDNWRLRTNLLLSHVAWTESSPIDISLVLSVRPGHELELCKPVKVMFATKPVKRGI